MLILYIEFIIICNRIVLQVNLNENSDFGFKTIWNDWFRYAFSAYE